MGLMTHVVAGYPSREECIELLLGMQKAGVGIMEVQIPFSDPIADGETIMKANDKALAQGIDTEDSFKLIEEARLKGLKAEIYIMSYAQKLIHNGIGAFCKRAGRAGAKGLIIPDLPFDSPEYKELIRATAETSLQIVPVVSPGISAQRLKGALANSGELVYLTSTKGITGNRLLVSDELGRLSGEIRKLSPDKQVAIGFGIRNADDVSRVLKIADLAVVGSSVIREVEKGGANGALKFIRQLG